jgi:hypothetical protein
VRGTHIWRAQTDGVRTRTECEQTKGTHMLVSLAAQANRQVRTQTDSKWANGTHFLQSADRQTSEDMERKHASEGTHQLEHRTMEKQGDGKIATKRRALTCWRMQTDRQVRTQKESS